MSHLVRLRRCRRISQYGRGRHFTSSTAQRHKHQIVTFEGDGIGPELMASTKQILSAATDASNIELEFIDMPFGYNLFKKTGAALTRDHLAAIEEHKLVLKGPVTIPTDSSESQMFRIDNLDTGTSYTSPNQALRKYFQLYGNVRPAKSYKASPFQGVDIVVVRENTEDLYSGEEHVKDGGDTVEAVKRITRRASTRIARFALELAAQQKRRKVTAVHKANVCKRSDGLFLQCHRDVFDGAEAAHGVAYEEQLADSLLFKLMAAHTEFSVLSCPNLFGDLVSDLLGGMIGSLGLMPSAQFNRETGVAVFEPTHGSAPDIAAQNIANPISLWRSAVMMLEHLGHFEVAQRIEGGIEFLLDNDYVTPELNGTCSTTDMTRLLCTYLKDGTV